MGHVQAHGRADVPPRARPLLDPQRAPGGEPARRGPRQRHDRLQIRARAPGVCAPPGHTVLRQGPLPAILRLPEPARQPAHLHPASGRRRLRRRPEVTIVQPGRERSSGQPGRRRRELRAARAAQGRGGATRRGDERQPARHRHECGVRGAQPLCSSGQGRAPDPHQEPAQRGDQEVPSPRRLHGRHLLRRHRHPALPQRGPHGSVRRAATHRNGRARHSLHQVRGVVQRHEPRRHAVQARHRHRQPQARPRVHRARDHPRQVRGLGRLRRLCLHHSQPHQVRAAQRRLRHHPHARHPCVPHQGVRKHCVLP
mmetsp:Transcript_25281/g.63302  ORF Transcript_25281/g.63302 Transcript_25281/m.63302 type:complete len:312 (+) Transcript_25281:258-1193(+)